MMQLVEGFRDPTLKSFKQTIGNIMNKFKNVDLRVTKKNHLNVWWCLNQYNIFSNEFKTNKNKHFCDNRLHEVKLLMLNIGVECNGQCYNFYLLITINNC